MRKGWIITGAVGLVIGVAGVATAGVAGNGLGSLTGKAGAVVAPTVTGSFDDLYANHSAGAHLTLTNPNPVPVTVEVLTPTTLDSTGYGVTGVSVSSVPAGDSINPLTVNVSVPANSTIYVNEANAITLDDSDGTTAYLQAVGTLTVHYSSTYEQH